MHVEHMIEKLLVLDFSAYSSQKVML